MSVYLMDHSSLLDLTNWFLVGEDLYLPVGTGGWLDGVCWLQVQGRPSTVVSVQLTSWGQYWQGWYESSTAGSYRGCGTVEVYNSEFVGTFWSFFPMGILLLIGYLLALDPACGHSPGSGNTGVWCIAADGTETQQKSGVQALTEGMMAPGSGVLTVDSQPLIWLQHLRCMVCSYHAAGIWSMDTTTARVLGSGVCTGLRRQPAVLVPGQQTSSFFWGGKNKVQQHLSLGCLVVVMAAGLVNSMVKAPSFSVE